VKANHKPTKTPRGKAGWCSAFLNQHAKLTQPAAEHRQQRLSAASRRRSQSRQRSSQSSQTMPTMENARSEQAMHKHYLGPGPYGPMRKPIRQRTSRKVKLMAYYNAGPRAEHLAQNPICTVHCGKCKADQIHHSRGRLGTLLIDRRFFKGVCCGGHAFCEKEKAMARQLGLLCKVGEWNTPPKDAETRRLELLIIDLTTKPVT